MRPTLNEKFIAYLALITGLVLSAVAVYYSVVGLTAIFSAAVVPIIIMGTALEISKLVATIWLKQNWDVSPRSIKIYLISAIVILMLITSMGIFGFLSKAHNDQNLVSGEVLSKIAIYDEKIKIAKENIDANRRALKQLDEAVDQVMGRSTTEQGAERSVQIRRQQGPERQRLIREIEAEQKEISSLNEARAPIAAEVRKVEAEVGPIKYIAAFFYGETDQTILEKAVTWVILIIVLVFDPLAVVLLLAAQTSFQEFRRREQELEIVAPVEIVPTVAADVDEKPTEEAMNPEPEPSPTPEPEEVKTPKPLKELISEKVVRTKVFPRRPKPEQEPEPVYVQNEEQKESNLWTNTVENKITSEDYTKIAQSRREAEILNYAELVRSKRIQMVDVPEEYQDKVKSLV